MPGSACPANSLRRCGLSDEIRERPAIYIENHFPTELLNEQVQTETGATPFNGVHRWFSRKPLSFSRAAILASILPATITPDDFQRLLGVPAQRPKDFRLYKQTPSASMIADVQSLSSSLWGEDRCVLDAFAGGGSIPFEALRYHIKTLAFDLNPVAVATMKAGLEVPFHLGLPFVIDLRHWVERIGQQAQERLQTYFPSASNERIRDYLWAHTVSCSECSLLVPLAPNWWVHNSPASRKAGRAVAIRVIAPDQDTGNRCSFEIVQGSVKDNQIDGYDPSNCGTLARANGRCPRCHTILSTNYLMEQGQAGQFTYSLYAVSFHDERGVLSFRAPVEQDLRIVEQAESTLKAAMPRLLRADVIPVEMIPHDTQRGSDLNLYGLYSWQDLYTPRQLLTLSTLLDLVREAIQTYRTIATQEQSVALALWLAMILDRCADKNSRLSRWDGSYVKVQSASATHSLNLMWNFPELNGATRLWQLSAETVTGDYHKLCELARSAPLQGNTEEISPVGQIDARDAANLFDVADRSITAVVTDPPYYSAIRYAEIADMYYVWEKRALGTVLPDLYMEELCNKELEAIANPGRFRGLKNAAELADRDYEMKMARAFAEYYRVLRDDGVLTVQFNHKDSGAWDILSQTLINAGFEITATWAVNTENPNSIHQAEKNAVNSTVLLVCRKRREEGAAWWEEIQPRVRRAVMERVPLLQEAGIKGIDLYLAAFGPALKELSRNWPVRTRDNIDVRPEAALKEARSAVVDQRMLQVADGHYVQIDPISRYYLIAWDCFLTHEFPFDEARLLALSTGDVSITELRDKYHLLGRKGNDVILLTPRERVRLGEVKLQAVDYPRMVDALHASLALYMDEGISAVRRFFDRTSLLSNPDFKQFIELVLKMVSPSTDEHKALVDMLNSDIKLRSTIQMPLFGDIDIETYEQPRMF
jgi:putative DNA methylase